MIKFAEIFFNAADNHLARTGMLSEDFTLLPVDDTENRSVYSCDAIDKAVEVINNCYGGKYLTTSNVVNKYVHSFGLNPMIFNGFREFDAWEDRQDVRCAWLYLLGTDAEEENLWYDPDTAQLMEKIGEDYRPYQIPSQSDCSCDEDKEGW